MTLTLTKTVTVTVTAVWCRREFMVMSLEFRQARRRLSDPMDKCFWCNHKFEDGEMMSLAAFKGEGNKILCGTCADDLLASDSTEAVV